MLSPFQVSDVRDATTQKKIVYDSARHPIEDRSFLPATAKEMCKGLKVYWLKQTMEKSKHFQGIKLAIVVTHTICPDYVLYIWYMRQL